ncbi:MAG: hypothetical protein Q9P01_04100 [Anaerolineae bacterium]|nr:hypothetical protein [Anaerolineae bacterium]MDQ7034028.1 hypothetical protein [Anaerolineae bacterium]
MTTLADLQSSRAQMVNFKVGESFPSIVLPNADNGRAMSLADFHGQKVLLHIFASW